MNRALVRVDQDDEGVQEATSGIFGEYVDLLDLWLGEEHAGVGAEGLAHTAGEVCVRASSSGNTSYTPKVDGPNWMANQAMVPGSSITIDRVQ